MRHPVKWLSLFVMWGTVFSWLLQSYISADQFELMFSGDKVGLTDYLRNGYRFGAEDPEGYTALLKKYAGAAQRQIQSLLRKSNLKNISEIFTFMEETEMRKMQLGVEQNGILAASEFIARRKPIFSVPENMWDANILKRTGSVLVDGKYTCRILLLSNHLDLKWAVKIRLSGYLSSRFHTLLQYTEQVGMMQHFFSLERNPASVSRNPINHTNVIRVEQVIQARPFTIKSTVGMSAYIQISLMTAMGLLFSGYLSFCKRKVIWLQLQAYFKGARRNRNVSRHLPFKFLRIKNFFALRKCCRK